MAGQFFTGEVPPGIAPLMEQMPERQQIMDLLNQCMSNVARGNGIAARDYAFDALNKIAHTFKVDPFI